jgi:hypothetical protein
VEVVDDPLAGGPGAGVAPAQARPVIHHHGRVLGQVPLHVRPPVAGLAQGGGDHHRGAALAGAPQMQAATVDVDQLAGWREAPTIARLPQELVCGAGEPAGEQAKDAGACQGMWAGPHCPRLHHKGQAIVIGLLRFIVMNWRREGPSTDGAERPRTGGSDRWRHPG